MNETSGIKKEQAKHAYFDALRGAELVKRMGEYKASSGATQAKKYYGNIRLTTRQAVIAKCAECMGWYADGKTDCECPSCTLYPYMPYRSGKTRWVRQDRKKICI